MSASPLTHSHILDLVWPLPGHNCGQQDPHPQIMMQYIIYNIAAIHLSWLKSYLTDRHSFSHVNNCTSPCFKEYLRAWFLVLSFSLSTYSPLFVSFIIISVVSISRLTPSKSTSPQNLPPSLITSTV